MSVTKAGVTAEERTVTVNEAGLRTEDRDGTPTLVIDRIYADPGDTIRWDVGDRLVSIWFPTPGVFSTPLIAVMHRGTVEASVLPEAKEGVYEYAIFDHESKTYVTCESHPKIEIPKPGDP